MQVHGEHYTSEKSIDLYQCFGIATDWWVHSDVILSEWHAISMEMMMSFDVHRFFGDDASSNNGGYRAAAYVIELRSRESGNAGFLLPPDQVRIHPSQQLFILGNCVPTVPFIAPLPNPFGVWRATCVATPPDVWCVGSCDYHKIFFPQIIPTGEEIVPAVIHYAQFLLSTPLPFTPKDAVTQDNQYTVWFHDQYSPEFSS